MSYLVWSLIIPQRVWASWFLNKVIMDSLVGLRVFEWYNEENQSSSSAGASLHKFKLLIMYWYDASKAKFSRVGITTVDSEFSMAKNVLKWGNKILKSTSQNIYNKNLYSPSSRRSVDASFVFQHSWFMFLSFWMGAGNQWQGVGDRSRRNGDAMNHW